MIFIDESGLSERPTRVRTCGPGGQTPTLEYRVSRHQPFAIAGRELLAVPFPQFPGSISIGALQLAAWLGAHCSNPLHQYVEADEDGAQFEFLPAYEPERNPVEYTWGYLKNHEIRNLCARYLRQVSVFSGPRLKSVQSTIGFYRRGSSTIAFINCRAVTQV